MSEVIVSRKDTLDSLAKHIYQFDHSYMYSDDPSVWRNGRENENNLREYIKEAQLTESEKDYITELLISKWNSHRSTSWEESMKVDSFYQNSMMSFLNS